jgi:hypothetical protein
VNGLFADSDCQLCPTLQQTIADNFNTSIGGANVAITELVIWGGYYPENIPNAVDNFTIIVHSDAGGQPGTVIDTRSGLQATNRVSTGIVLFGCNEYMFTFDFSASPIFVPSAGIYWIELFNNSVESGNFFWETGNLDGTHGVVGSAWFTTTPGTSWNLDGLTDLSIKLNGDDAWPVELVSFEATANGTNVNLKWATASEINNSGFEVQRNAGSEFVTVGFVQGHGTTTETQEYSYNDNNLSSGSYTYRLKQVDYDGTFEYSDAVEVEVVVNTFALGQNYPNPFNPSTKISFSLPADSRVTLSVFNLLGEEVATVLNSNMVAGNHSIDFDAAGLNSGVYFYRINAQGIDGTNFASVKKMILTK